MSASDNDPFKNLDEILAPDSTSSSTPDPQIMIEKSLEVLSQSSMSFPLVEMITEHSLKIRVITTPREFSYVPETKDVYVGITAVNPAQPAKFILLLADALLEAKLDMEGYSQPAITETREKYVTETAERKARKVGHLCAIAFDLDQKEQFAGYRFIDEMHKLGHDKAMDVFVSSL
jgi:hypothetical protein